MKPLYSQAEFDAAKVTSLLSLECERCGKPFYKEKRRIQAAIKGADNQVCRFCSRKCFDLTQVKLTVLSCNQCKSPFPKLPNQVKKTKHHFCSMSCAAKYHNAHKTMGTRVSKLELWLQEQLPLLFPGLEFHFNRTDAIEAELDIYVPSLQLAFELNGIFHYEPIYGPKKFASVCVNDERKMLACAEHGIELCVIDISSVSYFKPAKAQKFLDIIASLIRSKLSGGFADVAVVVQSEPRGGSLTF